MHPKGFPYEGKLSPKATDEVDNAAKKQVPHLIRHGFAVPPSPHRGRLWGAQKHRKPPRKKVQTNKLGLHLLLMADILRKLAANPTPPYQAARSRNS